VHPIHIIDSYTNSVFDVNWSPTHPAMFSTADADGMLNIFNLNRDIDVSKAKCENGLLCKISNVLSCLVTSCVNSRAQWKRVKPMSMARRW
jgi:hypothetical protein